MLIYKIKNIVTGNFYIGCTSNLENRATNHFSSLKNQKHISKRMQEDYNTYSEKSFVFGIIKNLSANRRLALKKETLYISRLKPKYNKRITDLKHVSEKKKSFWRWANYFGATAEISRITGIKRDIIHTAICTGKCNKEIEQAIDKLFADKKKRFKLLINKSKDQILTESAPVHK